MVELFIIFGAILGIVYFSHQHRERMTLIKKGEHAGRIKFRNNRNEAVRLGAFLIGLALGFIGGALFAQLKIVHSDIAYIAMLLLFGGLGLLVGTYVVNQKDKDTKEEN